MGATMNPQDRLARLYNEARRAGAEGISTSDFEPAAAALLDFIQATPECVDAASRLFVRQVMEAGGSTEVLDYCMHELRWSEVREAARVRVAESEDWRIKTPLASLLAAFEDDWPDAKLYERWRARPSS